jgi:hypothetical protein
MMIFPETNENIAMENSHLFSFAPFWQIFTQRKMLTLFGQSCHSNVPIEEDCLFVFFSH